MYRTTRKANLLASVLLSATAIVAAGGGAKADVTDQLLDRLNEKGILTKSEYRTFKARHAAEVRANAKRTRVVTREVVTKDGGGFGSDILRVIKPTNKGIAPGLGVGARVGEVDVTLSGEVNAFGVQNFGASNNRGTPIFGGLAAGSRFLAGPNEASSSYASRNGLLPAALLVNLSTRQEGYDIGVNFGIFPGINLGGTTGIGANNGGSPVALTSSGVDFRKIYATIGNETVGTLKGGRDIGLFGSDAILNDFTIFGAGSPGAAGGNAAPANTTLGRIGLGYVYADFLPQLTYTTPNVNGFTASVSAVSPLNQANFSTLSGALTQHSQPQFQGQVKYAGALSPAAKVTLWVDGLTQESIAGRAGEALPGGRGVRSNAVDGGGKLEIGPATLVGYGYYGVGLGTTGIFLDGIDPTGNRRESYGGYGQVAYDVTKKLTFAGSYGTSFLQATAFDSVTAAQGNLVRKNESFLGAARYKLTSWVNLQGEFVHTITTSQNGNKAEANTISAGSILFF